jgi:hydroxypyruvate reductase
MPCHGHDPRLLLRALFDTAIEAVSACRVLPACLPQEPAGRTVLLAVGKAASAMANVVVERWRGQLDGLVVTRYGHAVAPPAGARRLEVIEARHPVPDAMSVAGARRALELVRDLGPDDLVLVLVSGGGSALWCLPIEGVTLDDKQAITANLLAAGASIRELNTVRRWLSRIKGGRLAAAAHPARIETLIISDVVSNDPAIIASGPTVPAPDTLEQVEAILARYRLDLPARTREAMRRQRPVTADLAHNRTRIVAVPADALAAAEREARACGFDVRMLGDGIEGEARDAAAEHARIAKRTLESGRPTVILSGGEVTVAVHDETGIGGPNTEFALALALELDGAAGIHALACDTDGYDGVGDNAGAIIGPDTLERAALEQVDPHRALECNDSCRFFEILGDLVVTGPTQTNVSDFRAIVVCPDR